MAALGNATAEGTVDRRLALAYTPPQAGARTAICGIRLDGARPDFLGSGAFWPSGGATNAAWRTSAGDPPAALGGKGTLSTDGTSAPGYLLGRGTPYLPVGVNGRFRIPVDSGARTIKIDVKNDSKYATAWKYPRLTVFANPAVGLATNKTASATSGTGWQTLTVTFTATAAGGVEAQLESFADQGDGTVRVDNLVVT